MGQKTGDSNDDKKRVFPLEPRQIKELKDHMEEELDVNKLPSVASGWKLR
jgi:hypothetical protein